MASIVKGKSIVVAGDVALDWHIANLPDHQKTPASNEALPSRICWHFGGSLLLTDLIAEIVSNQKPKGENWTLHRVTIDPASICPIARIVEHGTRLIAFLQQGRIAIYLLYSFVTLLTLLVLTRG